ncbi:hypothetical protein [Bremerella alba]|uniref:Carboxypeptidase regulatory-like domain-containing protein n=1 Tax=Bremerella alba TaxID=980252 RepID=A0A7V8V219_9BACT|nr:hypothetical protein [Bremerella alba]MBA2113475.1 hypothetical protein [Bremerella alba]
MNRYLLSTSVLLALAATGCFSDSGQQLHTVDGTITQDGVPFVDAQLEFEPQTAGAPSYGKSDENGDFKLYYSTGKPGAAPGQHIVKVLGGRKASDAKPSEPTSIEAPAAQRKEYRGKEIVVTVDPNAENHVEIEL